MARNIHVTKRPDGNWQTITRASHVTKTQEQVRLMAGEQATRNHSEVLIYGVNGKIRARDSYGNDSYPPKG